MKSKTPFFSIITSTKNVDKFVSRNIDSVKKQTFRDLEHIFIDGYSKDNTLKIIKKYKRQLDYPVIIYQTKPKGISHAMNQGIKKAGGNYLIHLHADDCFYNHQVLENIHDFLVKNPKLDWIYGQIQTTEEGGSPIGIFPRHKILQTALPWLLSYTNFIPHQAVFIKKEVFKKYGIFDEKLTSKMDLDLWLRIRDKTTWTFFPKIVSCFTVHSGAQSSSKKFLDQNLKNLDYVLKKHLSKPEYFLSNYFCKLQQMANKMIR